MAAAACAQFWALPGAYLGFENDDAQFVLASRGLADFHAYRFFTFPGAPPVRIFTPGWPLLLAPIAALFPDRPGAFTVFAFAILLLCDVLAWIWLRKRLGPRYGLAAFLMFALSPLTLARSGRVMTEAPLLALTLAYLVWRESKSSPSSLGSGSLLASGWLIRPAAVALVPAFVAEPLLRRDWTRALLTIAPLAVVWLAWHAWTGGFFKESTEFFFAASGGIDGAPAVAWDNFCYYAAQWGGSFWTPGYPGQTLVGFLLIAAAGWGLAADLQEDVASTAAWIVLGWAALHAVWPWHFGRYLLPIAPVLWYFAVRGLLKVDAQTPSAKVAPSLVLVGALVIGEGLGCLSWLKSPPVPLTPELSATYQWIREKTPGESVFASLLWGRDTLYAERAFSSLPSAPDANGLAAELHRRGVRYVLWYDAPDLGFSAGAGGATGATLSLIQSEITPWHAAYSNASEHSRVLAVPAP